MDNPVLCDPVKEKKNQNPSFLGSSHKSNKLKKKRKKQNGQNSHIASLIDQDLDLKSRETQMRSGYESNFSWSR